MKPQPIRFGLLSVIGLLSSELLATTITFSLSPWPGNNTDLPADFASHAASNGSGWTTTDGTGTTPDIALVWSPTGGMASPFRNVLDLHNSPVFGNGVPVLQFDTDLSEQTELPPDPTVDFLVAGDRRLQLHSLRIGNATDQSEAAYRWQMGLLRLPDQQPVALRTTSYLSAGDWEKVAFDFTGEAGVSYRLQFDDEGANRFRTAIDDLSFSQTTNAPPARPVLVIAHRGYSQVAPENTVAAFRATLGLADLVESDVRTTSDGQLVIMHDDTVDRTTDGTGAVAALTQAQVRALDAGAWFSAGFIGERVPTFAEMVTNILPAATPLIEHKAGTAAAFVSALQGLNAVTNVVVQSFDWNFLGAMHALEPVIRLCALGSGALTAASLTNITNAGADTVAWAKANIGPAEVALVHAQGLKLFAWTVNSSAEMRTLVALGVDGLITDDPVRARELQQVNTNTFTDLQAGLVAYWSFDDGQASPFTTVVADAVGTNHGTLVRTDGASHWLGSGEAKLGGCLQVAGTNAWVNLPNSTALNLGTNALTLSAWVWLPALPGQLATSFGAIFDSTTDAYVLYLDRGNRELRFKITDVNNQAARPGIGEALLPTNQWIHIVAVYSGTAEPGLGEASIYLNGQVRDSHLGTDGSSPAAGLTGNVKPGQLAALGREGPSGGNHFTGRLDDLALWRRALTPGDVARIHAAGLAGQSLAQLWAEPMPNVQFTSVQPNSARTHLELRFHRTGLWNNFQLQRADSAHGDYAPVNGLIPVNLGNGTYQFNYPVVPGQMEYFRIAAW